MFGKVKISEEDIKQKLKMVFKLEKIAICFQVGVKKITNTMGEKSAKK